MNPLTLVKRIQSINSKEAQLGISEDASWHAKYKDSAYVFAGGIPFDLTEGDLLAVFAQYGEIVDVNLVRDKATGKSKGFAFVAYEDQRSTVLAVDNLNGAQILGRTIRVDHVSKYKKKAEEDEEEEQRKREERGVCRAFQRGDCTRGASCKFSHNEQRAANTGWGEQDTKWGRDKYDDGPKKGEEDEEEQQRKREERGACRAFQRGACTRGATCKFSHNEKRAANTGWGEKDTKWGRNNYDGPKMGENRSNTIRSGRGPEPKVPEEDISLGDNSRGKGFGREEKRLGRDMDVDEKSELRSRDHDRGQENRSRRRSEEDNLGPNSSIRNGRREEQRSRRHYDHEVQPKSREDHDKREDGRSSRRGDDAEFEVQPKSREDHDKREDGRSSRRGDDAEFEAKPKFTEDLDRKDSIRKEEKRPSKRGDDNGFDPKSREDRDGKEYGRGAEGSRGDTRLRGRGDDNGFDPKSREDRDRREYGRRVEDSREDTRLREHAGDEELDLKSREDRDRTGKRSRSYNDKEYPPKSRGDHDMSEGKRSRHNDESEPKSRAGLDKREGERFRRHENDEVQPKSREVRYRSE